MRQQCVPQMQYYPQQMMHVPGESGEVMMHTQQMHAQQMHTQQMHTQYPPSSEDQCEIPPPPVYLPNGLEPKRKLSVTTTVTIDDIDDRTDYANTPTQEDAIDYDQDFKEKETDYPNTERTGKRLLSDLDGSLFDNFVLRTLYINSTLFIFSILSFPLWFGDIIGGYDSLQTAYILAAFSIIIIFNASICGLILGIFEKFGKVIPHKKYIIYIVMSIYFIGGFFYFVAGCQYAQSYNNLGDDIDNDLSAFGGIFWTEMFYVASVSIIAGVDLWKRFLNVTDHRVCTFFSLYVFCSMILAFSYLTAGGKDIASSVSSTLTSIGVSYLFGWLISITYLIFFILNMFITEEYVMKPTMDRLKPMFDSIGAVLLFIFMIFTSIAYMAGKREQAQESSYYFGFGVFMLAICIIMIFDIKFWDFVEICVYGKDDDEEQDEEEEEDEENEEDEDDDINDDIIGGIIDDNDDNNVELR